jgi:hypothetical protein
MDAHTGSTTNGTSARRPMPMARHVRATAVMMAAEASMPVLAACTPMSVTTASICAATMSGGISTTPVTRREFCTVTAVTATQPCTPHAVKVRRSACSPALPPESEPAMVRARGGVRVPALTPR